MGMMVSDLRNSPKAIDALWVSSARKAETYRGARRNKNRNHFNMLWKQKRVELGLSRSEMDKARQARRKIAYGGPA